MSMPSRAERQTDRSIMRNAGTDGNVGPGSYGVSIMASTAAPSYAGFSSSDARRLNNNKSQAAANPGPGSYLSQPYSQVHGCSSNAFKTSVPRLAPTAPGSTLFQESTSRENPGPGDYQVSTAHKKGVGDGLDHGLVIRGAAERLPQGTCLRPANDGGKYNPPAIPAKTQSYGFEDSAQKVLKPLPPPTDVYSGFGADTVGPAFYDPSCGLTKQGLREGGASFAQTRTRRRVFEPDKTSNNWLPERSVPGPGYVRSHTLPRLGPGPGPALAPPWPRHGPALAPPWPRLSSQLACMPP